MPVTIPFALNLTIPGGATVPGYTNFSPAAYSAGLGYGYLDVVDLLAFKRGINADEKYDTLHLLDASAVDDIRIDVPTPAEYDVIVAVGDPSQAITNGIITISDTGVGGTVISGIVTGGANQFKHVGAVLLISSYLQVRIGKVVGGPFKTAVPFLIVNPTQGMKSSLRSLTPFSQRASKTPTGSKRLF